MNASPTDTSSESVKVKIMDRDYVFACAPDEKESLMECVALVDAKMNAVKQMGRLVQVDRIAVMVALMLASDFMALQRGQGQPTDGAVEALQRKTDIFLNKLKNSLTHEKKSV